MENDYISRRDAFDAIVDLTVHSNMNGERVDAGKVADAINALPAADVATVKHGHWIGISDGYADGCPVYDAWECSVCGYDAGGA